jgi:hypothetical protein
MASREAAIKNNLNDRARKVGQFDELTTQDIDALIAFYDYSCLKCGLKPATSVDHVKPLVSGGTNTFDNLQLLCVNCNKGKQDREEDYRKGRIFTGEYEDSRYDLEHANYNYETGEMNQGKSASYQNLDRRGGKRANAGRKPSEYTLLKRRVIAENVEDADRAFDLYVQIMDNPEEETNMRLAAADRVMDRVLGKATEHSQQERKIIIQVIRENPEQHSIGAITALALGTGTD